MERLAALGSVSSAEEADVTANACEDTTFKPRHRWKSQRRDVCTSDCKAVNNTTQVYSDRSFEDKEEIKGHQGIKPRTWCNKTAIKSHTVDGSGNSDHACTHCSRSSGRVHSKQHQMQFMPDNKYFLLYVVYLFTIALISVHLHVHTVLGLGQ